MAHIARVTWLKECGPVSYTHLDVYKRQHLGKSDSQAWSWLLSIALVFSFFAALFNYWRLLKITEAPTSTIASAAQGYIELQGVASTLKAFKTPYHGIPCVWYRGWVYANRLDNPCLLYTSRCV